MPYQGERDKGPRKFKADVRYLKKLPGVLVVIQLVCCALGFFLSLGASFVWRGTAGQSFFTFIVFVASLGCFVWLVVHVFQLYTLTNRTVNWNIMGIVHNGVFGFFVMIASCVMIEVASEARPLRAAGVFGFLGFTGFLMALAWEVMMWLKNRDPGIGFNTATVVEGPKRPESLHSIDGEVNLRDEIASREDHETDAAVGFVGMKARPVSSFIQEPNQNGEVTTPMLYAPGNDDDDEAPRPKRASAISEKSEASSNSSSVQGEWQTPS
ncbi:CKLF-like MARVEL transmembrane domain-containing protein 4 [Macrobrachium nipponense]|uniref:CKLF-like MARVEL transmembrane domain-containing protein 4 n=1 Tax=Macrobrachium nipponense TaxID=159736 RepID=UPI0030C8AF66